MTLRIAGHRPSEYARAVTNLGAAQVLLYAAQALRAKLMPPRRAYPLYSRHLRFPVRCRPRTSDIHVFNQIFVQREYRCLDDVDDASLVIDCGANVGYATAYFLSRFPRAFVIAVEPDAENFRGLEANLAPYAGRYRAICSAVWSRPCRLVLKDVLRGEGEEWARQVREAADGERDAMTAVDIDTLLAESGFERISVLKVDIEGAETAVFGTNYEAWLPKVDNLVIELHGPPCEEAFQRAIAGQGFEVSRSEELVVCRRPRPRSAPAPASRSALR